MEDKLEIGKVTKRENKQQQLIPKR